MKEAAAIDRTSAITELYQSVRERTMQIVTPLETEDYVIQTAEFMSPPRWHIGHTSWFFETVLQSYQPGYQAYSPEYLFYFNSYYEGFGARIDRPRRGTRSRPTVRETVAYRNYIDERMLQFLASVQTQRKSDKILSLVRLGLEHEMQHQELLVYDIKHLLCDQFAAPLKPTAKAPEVQEERHTHKNSVEIDGGLFWLGYGDNDEAQQHGADVSTQSNALSAFAFDNEKPAHQVFLQPYAIDRFPVSVGDYLEFMRDGGYRDFRWWFSEGWEVVNREGWQAPLYWELHDGMWMIRDFAGLHPAESKQSDPVSHVSYFEASAYAKWAGRRLPTEGEWEKAACFNEGTDARMQFPWGDGPPGSRSSNLFENGHWTVAPIGAFPAGKSAYGCEQMIGDVWEWTTSDYVPYPGFKSEFDEYNDKWFVNQKVLRGGSFATPRLHIRSTYRNFFHAHERWMVSGFRCASDLVPKSQPR
jgi:ergothioneine biosynthesis protein EgtB